MDEPSTNVLRIDSPAYCITMLDKKKIQFLHIGTNPQTAKISSYMIMFRL